MDKKLTTTLFVVLSLLVVVVLVMQIQKFNKLETQVRQLVSSSQKQVEQSKDNKKRGDLIDIGSFYRKDVAKINDQNQIESLILGFKFDVPENWKDIKVEGDNYKEFYIFTDSDESFLGTTGFSLGLAGDRGAQWVHVSDKLNEENKDNYCQVLEEDNTFRSEWVEDCTTFVNENDVQVTQINGGWDQLFVSDNIVENANMYIIHHPHPVMRSVVLTDIYLLRDSSNKEEVRNQVKKMVNTFKFTNQKEQ